MQQPDLFAEPPPPPVPEPVARRARGIRRAAEHARAVVPEWEEAAYAAFVAYAMRGQPFLTEDVRAEVEKGAFPRPPDGRAWGQIASRARRAGVVRRVGAAPAASSNCSLKPLWQRVP